MLAFMALSLHPVQSNAQAPQKFNYQGIARDAKGNPVGKQTLGIKLSVLPAQDATTPEYEEVQTVTTNEFGLYTLQIGNGTAVTGSMNQVKWESGNKYIHVSIDPAGGTQYVDAGTSQLLSVPYALYADRSGLAKESANSTRATNNFIEKTNGSGVANSTSQLYDNGTNIGYGTTTPSAKFHISNTVAAVQEHLRMQNLSATGAGRFTMYNDGASSYATFTKYGTTYAGGYAGVTTLYPYANLLAFGNNGVAAGDGKGRFLISTGGNVGISIFKSGTSKLKFHADYTTENVGIGGNSAPIARVHLNNTDGTTMDVRVTNNTTGHTATDGLEIKNVGSVASITNLENANLTLGTNNATRLTVTAAGNVEVANQVKIAGGSPGAGKVLTSDAAGLATWTTPSITSAGGTTNYIPKYTPNGTTLGNSALKDSTTYGLMYNAPKFPSGFYNYHYNIPAGSSYFNSFYNIHQPNFYHNYLTLTNNSNSGSYQGMILGDSATVNRWFAVSSSSGDSVGAFYKTSSAQNTVFMGSTSNKGLYVQLRNGKMGNTENKQAHFSISSSYDTVAHFTSNSTNLLGNGIVRAEYVGTANNDHVAIYARSKPDTLSYGIGISTVGGYQGLRSRSESGESWYTYGIDSRATGRSTTYGVYAGANRITSEPTALGTKYGVYSYAEGGAANYGIYAYANNWSNPIGYGGYFLGKQTGVYGVSDSASANQTNEIGSSYGYKESIGVFGASTATDGYSANIGLAGSSLGSNYWNIGTYGEAKNATHNYAIYGHAGGTTGFNYAGYFQGNVEVAGNLSKSGGTFKIDHPQDPENKYLIHSFVESPDMMNVYNGNIKTDATGKAIVTLPSYFEAENKDFKYQLTIVDETQFAMARVSKKISGNQFEVMTDKPNIELSWQVTGVRQDAWANKHRVVAEVEKDAADKGHFLHPELFGAGDEKAIGPGRKLANPSTVKTPTYEEQKAQVEKDKKAYEQREQEDAQKLNNWKPQPSIQDGNTPNNARGLK